MSKLGRFEPVLVEDVVTGAAAIDFTVSPVSDFRLIAVLAHFASDPGDGLTITLDSVNGSEYDTVLATETNVGTDFVYIPTNDLFFKHGNEIVVTGSNAGNITYGLTVIYELV